MLKKTMTYTDYNGNQVTDDFYFNLTKAELIELEISTDKAAGLEATINKLQEELNGAEIMALFKKIIRKAIGKKSVDGKRFIKNDEIADEFMQTEAYSDLFMEICTDAKKAAEFFNAIVPQSEEQQRQASVPAPPVKH